MHSFAVIQAFRAVAAIAVIVSHLTFFEEKYLAGPPITPPVLLFGMLGVDLFFVISGFIITRVGLRQFGRPGKWYHFLGRRFIRIYPIYWFYCLLLLPVFLVSPGMINSSYGPPNLVTSFLLLPDKEIPLLAVAWSLVHEVSFYAVFAVFLLCLQRRHLPLALALWVAVVVIGRVSLGPCDNQPWLHVMLHPLTLEFLAGCVVALTVHKLSRGVSIAFATTGLVVMVAGSAIWCATGAPMPDNWPRVLVFGTAAALLVAGGVGLEQTFTAPVPRVLVRLGDASYSLYLSHSMTIAVFGLVVRRVVTSPGPYVHALATAVAVGVGVLGGWLGYRLVEAPLLAGLHSLSRRGSERHTTRRERRISTRDAETLPPASGEQASNP